MASFRVTLTIGILHPGVDPAAVLPGIADAVREVSTVEAADLSVARGEARVVIRFTADDTPEHEAAMLCAATALTAARALAQVTRETLTRRDGGDWVRLR